ncbi:hypothetical protein LB545_07670 [Mesorhizobium sp. BR1-1-6]|uniref:hypothetical protein n=1 Tax=Mesorhizobium sp. BR1-1-6 TaxID=2876648 RepID=UPI001CD0AD9A|nr:hypothetical protein [Mesorhizobium sp. BR1-1-6]MBZ9894221.1 hypothetical protein [Mesorhizobium sp. BR1-1-6]
MNAHNQTDFEAALSEDLEACITDALAGDPDTNIPARIAHETSAIERAEQRIAATKETLKANVAMATAEIARYRTYILATKAFAKKQIEQDRCLAAASRAALASLNAG